MLSAYAGRKPPSIGSYDAGKLEQRAREVTKAYHGSFYPSAFLLSIISPTTRLLILFAWVYVGRMKH